MIEAIIFDLDDTLFPEEQFVMSGFREVSEWLEREGVTGSFFETAWKLFLDGERRFVFDRALQMLTGSCSSERVNEMVKVYREHFPSLELFEDARWAVPYAQSRARTGLITDGYLHVQRNKVQALSLEQTFDVIVYSDCFGREGWKPSPKPYERVMEALGCPGEQCVYIADNPVKDFVTAKRLGWKTIRIVRENGIYADATPDPDHEAEITIKDLRQIEHLL